MWVLVKRLYLLVLLVAACSAAAPAFLAELITWASAKVSGTVTSHASGFPLAHGRIVVPSGRLPSSRIKPTGSITAWIWARFSARQMISFRCLWRCCLGPLLRQANPWRPLASTGLPHPQSCGSHALQPSLWATAILTSSSDRRRPTDAISGADSQSAEWGVDAANNLTIIIKSTQKSRPKNGSCGSP